MKNRMQIITFVLFLAGTAFAKDNAVAPETNAADVEFHVSPNGIQPFSLKDAASHAGVVCSGITPAFWLSGGGSAEKPFATLFQAQLAVREYLRVHGMPAGGIKVILHDGVYRPAGTIDFLPEDSGTPEHPVVYEAASGARPVLSGGVEISDWKKAGDDAPGLPAAAKGHVWAATAPREDDETMDFRQLYVNDVKAIRARTPNVEKYNRLQKWDIANLQVVVPASAVGRWHNLKRVEMVLQQSWELSYLRLASITIEGDKARITFQEPERTLVFSRPYPWSSNNEPYHFVNALEFLDAPGEWYLDNEAGRVYYWPRPGENMATAKVTAPRLKNIVRLVGTLERPVHDIEFKGIAFACSTWLRPARKGLVPLQAGMYLNRISYRIAGGKGIPECPGLDNIQYVGRPPAGVYCTMCNHVRFEDCTFRDMASAGLDFHKGTHDDAAVGCAFTCIGGNGIQDGTFSDDGFEVHLPYNPKDPREVSTGDTIADNWLHDCANEDWGCVGIAAGYVNSIRIEHNELAGLPYSGISVGWGWNPRPNCMADNKILFNNVHDCMKRLDDGGGIYTLSAQPGSEIRGNWIHHVVRDAMIYLDEGSSGILVKDNLTENTHYNRNKNGPGTHWENNGPQATGPIHENAGLEPAFRNLPEEGGP